MGFLLSIIIDLNDLNPITIWIFDKGDVFHIALFWTLFKFDTIGIKPRHRLSQIWYTKANMPKASWLTVAIMIAKAIIIFGAIIVRQLKDAALARNEVF